MEEESAEKGRSIFRDIRRYFCDFCGICRSKKSLITSHVLTHHKEEMGEKIDDDGEKQGVKSNTCEECGASFKKLAYLRQHMQSHSLVRPFMCTIEDCDASYRRKDHLTRHLLQHEGKLFKCPVESCNREFTYQDNMKRHVRELHAENQSPTSQKQYACQETGCGKVFKYLSRLQKHENCHVKLESVEAICLEPGCMKYFSDEECLKVHIQSCHQYINCEICGTKQLKKNIKRHLRTHDVVVGPTEKVKCHFKDCCHTFSSKTNLNQHVKSVHLEARPFACVFPGCGMRFSYRHVRDNHEKSGCHLHSHGDFEEADEQFRSRPRGGRKRKCPTVEMIMRKRVAPPTDADEYSSWLHSTATG